MVTVSLLPEGKGTGVGQSISWPPATHLPPPWDGQRSGPTWPPDSAVGLALPCPALCQAPLFPPWKTVVIVDPAKPLICPLVFTQLGHERWGGEPAVCGDQMSPETPELFLPEEANRSTWGERVGLVAAGDGEGRPTP